MPIKIWVRSDENHELTTWGYESLVDSAEANAPDDFATYGPAKYLWDGAKFVVRSGWTDPVAEPEAPADPE